MRVRCPAGAVNGCVQLCGDCEIALSVYLALHLCAARSVVTNVAGVRVRGMAPGGFVVHNRVMGRLAVSRAIGDVAFKSGPEGLPMVTATPEARPHRTACYPVPVFAIGVMGVGMRWRRGRSVRSLTR